MVLAHSQFQAILPQDPAGLANWRSYYWLSIGYVPPPPSPPRPSPPFVSSSGSRLKGSALDAVIIVPILAGLFLLAATVALILWRRRSHKGLLGDVVAPRVSPDTTLLLTDIENSTQLWERLDQVSDG